MNLSQRTIKHEISFSGKTAIHHGITNVTLKPSEANNGIIFLRKDYNGNNAIKVKINNLHKIPLNTTLSNGEVNVHIAEHMLAALWNFKIFNLIIELDGPEIPLLNGAADYFISLIKVAGIQELEIPQKSILLKKKLEVFSNSSDAKIIAIPSDSLKIKYYLHYDAISLLQQEFSFDSLKDNFEKEISFSRTFSTKFEHNERLNFAPGWSHHHAVIYDQENNFISCDNKLKAKNEAARHKILDAIGDLMLCEYPLFAELECYKSGHTLNQALVEKVFSDKDNYEII